MSTPNAFRHLDVNNRLHHQLLARMQRLRGRVYEADGAVRRNELTADGRHKLDVDGRSWHVLSLNTDGDVVACLRYTEESHVRDFEELRVRQAAVARCPLQGSSFRRAVEREMALARASLLGFGEVGGWAVHEEYRGTTEAVRIVLATYALLELLGGCVGLATATFRHSSEAILRRIGLETLHVDDRDIAPYHDEKYGCLMQVLRFDSRFPSPKYRGLVSALMGDLANSPVVCRASLTGMLGRVWGGVEAPESVPVEASSEGLVNAT
jgi:hypothetical protein